MDPASIPFAPTDESVPHDIRRHVAPPSSSQPFRMPSLASRPDLDLTGLDPTEPAVFQHPQHQIPRLHAIPPLPIVHSDFARHPQGSFAHNQPPPTHLQPQSQSAAAVLPPRHRLPPPPPPPPPPSSHSAPPIQGHFSSLASSTSLSQASTLPQLRLEDEVFIPPPPVPSSSAPENTDQRPHGQLVSRIVVDPPDLEVWRERLFNVDDTIILTNDQFETYFPHIDNVYSHRSTQKYKRKPFVSHYWDCRMKGRPPGTPKSDDPLKKKRKRFARERDLCDVKIKITEYFPGANDPVKAEGNVGGVPSSSQQPLVEGLSHLPEGYTCGEKIWTIQRVNGNGGNGKGDGVAGPHKHTLQKSDEIKKSTVQRYVAMQERDAKRVHKPAQKRPSGQALVTAKKHLKDHDLKLYAASFCPFSQRVWIALEAKGMQYQYCETDPFMRPTQLLEANPRGLVPAIREGEWASGESTIILEYLEDHDQGVPLFPTDPRLKANCRLWIDHINSKIVPAFFALVRATELQRQTECVERLRGDVAALVQAADERGPYFLGGDLCLVDIHIAPFVLRMSRLLRQYRSWQDPVLGTRWQHWANALEQNPHILATTSLRDLYVDTFDLFMKSRHAD